MLYKKLKTVFTSVLLSVALMFSPLVFAQPGMDYFNQGIKAAESKNYSRALEEFQKAKKAGLDTSALHYNFGVTYYKLGKYKKAKEAFTRLTGQAKYKQLAYYNLGLVANKQKNKAAAIKLFQRAFRSGKSDKVKVLSREALKRLGAAPEKISVPDKKWTGLLTASLGYDSNLSLLNDDQVAVSSISDTSLNLFASGSRWIKGNKSDGVRLFLKGNLQNYTKETDFNYNQFGIGAALYKRLGSWDTRYRGFWDESYFGGTGYQRILGAGARGRRALSNNYQLRLRYKVSQINSTNSSYDYLEGTRQQFRVGAQKREKANRFRAYYQLELNDREDYTNPAGTPYVFKSYSQTRHTFRVTGWWDITSMWKLRLDGRYRASQYNNDHIRDDSTTERREDTQTRFTARLSKKLDKDLDLVMAYRVTNNDSSIDSEGYDRNQVGLGLTWKY